MSKSRGRTLIGTQDNIDEYLPQSLALHRLDIN